MESLSAKWCPTLQCALGKSLHDHFGTRKNMLRPHPARPVLPQNIVKRGIFSCFTSSASTLLSFCTSTTALHMKLIHIILISPLIHRKNILQISALICVGEGICRSFYLHTFNSAHLGNFPGLQQCCLTLLPRCRTLRDRRMWRQNLYK
jgi:hypothetical protein